MHKQNLPQDVSTRSPAPTAPTPAGKTVFTGMTESANLFSPIRVANQPCVFPKTHKTTNLLLLAPWLQMGGADKFNLDLLRGLSQKNYRVSIATTLPNNNPWRDRFEEITPDVFCLPDFLDRSAFPAFLHRLIRVREIDILLVSNTTYGYYMLPWLRSQFPHLVVIDYVHMPEKSWRSGGYARLSGSLSEFLDKTYTCNNASCTQLVSEYNHAANAVETIYVGVDAEQYSPKNCPDVPVCEPLGIAPNRPIILFPCRMAPQKRPFLMLEIARHLRDKGSPVAFVCVGDGPDMAEMKSVIAQNNLQDTVYFTGPQRELRPYYQAASLTLICSLYEGLSLTAYESMAMETPVVTSDVGGQAELVTPDTGFVIPLHADEEKELYARKFADEEVALYLEAIEKLLHDADARQEMGHRARARILSGFTIPNMVEQMHAECTRLLTIRKEQGPFTLPRAPVLLFEELAILAGEFEKEETLVQRQQQQLAAMQVPILPAREPMAVRFWQAVAPLTNALDKLPLVRRLLSRNRVNASITDAASQNKENSPSLIQPLPPVPPTLPPTDTRLSVIIPTVNAGAEFSTLLQLLREQKGLPPLEIVIVDSGSTDDTVALARESGAVVIEIPSAEFTHSYARNLGAKTASGEYLLFMTQDALPQNEWWARRLLQPILSGVAQAATSIEQPREDADVYCRTAAFMRAQNGNNDYLTSLPATDEYWGMLRCAGLNNVACALSRETFERYGFRGQFAEDLDLGLRLLRDGAPLAFLASVPVIHSHNRPPIYCLKRSVVNYTFVPQILPSMPLPGQALQAFLDTALCTHELLAACRAFLLGVETDVPAGVLSQRLDDFAQNLRQTGFACILPVSPSPTGDDELDDILQIFSSLHEATTIAYDTDLSAVFIQNLQASAFAYLEQADTPLPAGTAAQIADVLLKNFATWLGENIAAQAKYENAPLIVKELAAQLCNGV